MEAENFWRRRVWSVLTVMFFDVLIVNASWAAALWIRFDFQFQHIGKAYLQHALQAAPFYTVLCLILFYLSASTILYGASSTQAPFAASLWLLLRQAFSMSAALFFSKCECPSPCTVSLLLSRLCF